jgi:RNA polymerase sigma-70 factor (ECF subfamily)
MDTDSLPNQRLVQLLHQVSRHDRDAFQQLYALTSSRLYAIALHVVRRREAADDVLQEAFFNVWQHAGMYAATLSTPMTWLISIVRNKALDRLRRGKLESESAMALDDAPHDVPEEAATHADSHDLYVAATERLELNRCMSLLEPSQRQSLALAYYNGMSHAELAEHLQVPLGTAKA